LGVRGMSVGVVGGGTAGEIASAGWLTSTLKLA
jgi:hypothetical protein